MDDTSLHLSTGRRTKRVPYKEDGTIVSETTTQRENVSTYLPPSSDSDDEVIVHANQPKKKGNYVPKTLGNETKTPICSDTVILCGKRSLHCQNQGNLLFRDLIATEVLLHQKYGHDTSYNKEYSLSEIVSKLKDFEWRKMEKRERYCLTMK